jgi:hypothetical protein
MKRIFVVTIVASLVGCATQAKFEAKMDQYIGQTESNIMSAYGQPQSSFVLNDGNKEIQYVKNNVVYALGPNVELPVPGSLGPNHRLTIDAMTTPNFSSRPTTSAVRHQGATVPVNTSCAIKFIIDKEGIVRQWNADGNHCN